MTELKWIKHDGGPIPVPWDAEVYFSELTEPDDWDNRYVSVADSVDWEITTWYAIVGDKTVPAIDAHYTKLKIEPMTYSMENGLDPMQHTVIKYVTRFRDKHGKRDLLAARHVIDMMIEREYGE